MDTTGNYFKFHWNFLSLDIASNSYVAWIKYILIYFILKCSLLQVVFEVEVLVCHTSVVLLVPLFSWKIHNCPRKSLWWCSCGQSKHFMGSSPVFAIIGGPASTSIGKELKALTYFKVRTSFRSFIFLSPPSSGKTRVNGVPLVVHDSEEGPNLM